MVTEGSFSSSGLRGSFLLPTAFPPSRAGNQLSKIRSHTFTADNVSRSKIGYPPKQGILIHRKTEHHSISGSKSLQKRVPFCLSPQILSAILMVPHARLRMRPFREQLDRQWLQITRSFEDIIQITPVMRNALPWWQSANNLCGAVIFLSSSRVCSYHRCVIGRLGGASSGTPNKRQMESISIQNAYQFSGTESNIPSPPVVSHKDKSILSPHSCRQYHLHALSQQAGRNKISNPILGSSKDLGMGITASHNHQGGASPMSKE